MPSDMNADLLASDRYGKAFFGGRTGGREDVIGLCDKRLEYMGYGISIIRALGSSLVLGKFHVNNTVTELKQYGKVPRYPDLSFCFCQY